MNTQGNFFYDQASHRVSEVRVQVVREAAADAVTNLDMPAKMVDFFRNVVTKAPWFEAEKECVIVILLSRKNHIKGWNLVSLGSQVASVCRPTEVFRPAIVAAAEAVVVMHNHPSGDPCPSGADMQVTREMRAAAKTLDIVFLDHVVVGDPAVDPTSKGYYSFRESGLI